MGMDSNNGNLDNNSYSPGTTQQPFQRVFTLGRRGDNWGSVNFGRQYTPVFTSQSANDLFRVARVGSIYSLTNVGVTRASNSIRYDSPSFSGFTLGAFYGLGDPGAASNGYVSTGAGGVPMDLGRQAGFAAMYNNGPLMLGVGYNKLYEVTPDASGYYYTQKIAAVTGSYDFKVVAINAG